MKFLFILNLLVISLSFCESGHIHSHKHNNELGFAVGVVPGHDNEENNIGLHLHYIKGVGDHNDFGIGISLETIFDEHAHNSISIIGTYHFNNGFTVAYAPGILFSEHDDEKETIFTQHFEFYYEFELNQFHLGPQIDFGFEKDEIHYMLGLHFGIDI